MLSRSPTTAFATMLATSLVAQVPNVEWKDAPAPALAAKDHQAPALIEKITPGPFAPTWEVPDDIPDEYLTQMESEHRTKEKGKWIWLQIGNRANHYFDCEAMQTAAATMLKLIGREAEQTAERSSNADEGAKDSAA